MCPDHFNSEHSEVIFERSVLSKQQPFADSRLVNTLADGAERLLASLPKTILCRPRTDRDRQ